jgi:pimeloyl-ACP methyl ester carboxylesterase
VLRAGEVQLGWREWGKGDVTVVFIHGNPASKDWIELAAPSFPSGIRVIGIDWRGCGESDRPAPAPNYANYSMQQHALDMLAALDALKIRFCHLATHSTGGIIAARMLLMQPARFGRVFALDPVTPPGLSFNADQIGLFRSMMLSREVTRAVMATAAVTLFAPESLAPDTMPRFREGVGELQAFHERLLEHTLAWRTESGSASPLFQTSNGRAANWNVACRKSGILVWCSGVRKTTGFLQPISGHGCSDAELPACYRARNWTFMNLELPAAPQG